MSVCCLGCLQVGGGVAILGGAPLESPWNSPLASTTTRGGFLLGFFGFLAWTAKGAAKPPRRKPARVSGGFGYQPFGSTPFGGI